jgi:hypothetical protein
MFMLNESASDRGARAARADYGIYTVIVNCRQSTTRLALFCISKEFRRVSSVKKIYDRKKNQNEELKRNQTQ